jgi:hypothetical protein
MVGLFLVQSGYFICVRNSCFLQECSLHSASARQECNAEVYDWGYYYVSFWLAVGSLQYLWVFVNYVYGMWMLLRDVLQTRKRLDQKKQEDVLESKPLTIPDFEEEMHVISGASASASGELTEVEIAC